MGDLDFLDRRDDAFLYTNEICHLLEVLELLVFSKKTLR